ncbi:MAG TPA: amidohydrolase family protein [Gemmatimonadaceae bacterium]|nr:amidohydrolase family protein [Gemmatimonadaceae bacterium]
MSRYHARWVVPIHTAPIENGTVVVEGRKIAWVGPRREAPKGDRDVDLGDAVLLPGLVNAHTHLELTAMRGFLEGLDFVQWIRTLTAARAAVLDEAQMLDSARLGIAEGLQAGITTYADTCSSGVAIQAMRDLGVRGIMYQEVFGPAPEQRDAAMAGLAAAIDRLRPLESDLVRLGVSPHAPYTVSDDLMIDASAYAVRHRMPVAIHLAESREEIAFLREGEGPFAQALRARGIDVVRRSHSPVHWLVEMGVMMAHPLLIHCVQVDADDISFIGEWSCPVAHCPASNAKLGHGIAPIREMLGKDVVVGLGSDSVASNNAMDLLAEARQAVLTQNAAMGRPDALGARQVLRLATMGGAQALGLAGQIGSLEAGKDADLAAFPLDSLRAMPVFDPEIALVFALPGTAARLVTVAGRERVRDGHLVEGTLDGAVTDRVRASARALAAWREEAQGR